MIAYLPGSERGKSWLWNLGVIYPQGKQCILLAQGHIRGTNYFS